MIEPVAPDEVAAFPEVLMDFQADREFSLIHSSSPEATALGEVSSVCLKFAGNLVDQAGLGSLERLVADDEEKRLMVFALNASRATPPGPRIFGLVTKPSAKLEAMTAKVTEFL